MKKALFALFAIAGSQSASAGMVYYLDLVNTASVNVVSFEVAEPGSTRFHSVIDKVLEGNGASATVAIRIGDGGCRRDMRIGFADGRVATHHDLDLCALLKTTRGNTLESLPEPHPSL